MFNNVLTDTVLTEVQYGEYLKIINTYVNLDRKSIFCRYYNINLAMSTYVENSESTFDRYSSGIRYDIYDYTPLFYIAQTMNDIADQNDLLGQMISGTSNAIIFTLKEPRVEDLIVFPYAPLNGEEIFRVSTIRPIINSKNSKPAVHWYELTLEYAPLETIQNLNIINHYVYNLSLQKYVFQEEFRSMLTHLKIMEEHFKNMQPEFDKNLELYTYHDPDTGIVYAPICQNWIIYNFLTAQAGYKNLFNSPLRPYGVKPYPNFCEDDCIFIEQKCPCNCDGPKPQLGHLNISSYGDLIKMKRQPRTIIEMEFDEELNSAEFRDGVQGQFDIVQYHYPINTFDLAELCKVWLEYERDGFPAVEDLEYATTLTEDSNRRRLILDDNKPYDIHKMITRLP